MRVFRPFFIVFWALFALFPASVDARQPIVADVRTNYRQAFAALESGQTQPAQSLVTRGSDPVLNTVLRGLLMAQPGNDYSFDDLAGFITDHPDWPGLNGILMIAEQKIPSGASNEQVVNWFNAHPPITLAGFYRFIDALESQGDEQQASIFIRDRWINRDFSADELAAFYARFGQILGARDHRSRLDRLLWANNITAARAVYPFVGAGEKALAEARIALANQIGNAEAFVNDVPSGLRNDPGLLFERLRWRRKNNLDDGAIEILAHAPAELGRSDNWWDERNIMIRRLIERKDYHQAYKLAADHGLNGGFDYVQAEFLAGWLALRFLDRADRAREHFEALLEAASTPISRARGAYWLGRSLEALGDASSAQQAYETAAALGTTYYGQLALVRLNPDPVIRANREPELPEKVKAEFFARDSVQAIKHLAKIGQTDRARVFFKAVTNYATQRFEFVLLMDVAYKLQRPDWAINAAKAAAQKNMLIGASAFPVLSLHIPSPPDPAFTHALIRQESLFNADAASPAGARGLMQLMPRTAQGVAKKLDVRYRESQLTDPSCNLKLGTAFIQHQIDQFDGSLILALAGYNAGPRRAREWIEQFGDPRSSGVDAIDWIELVPIYETRNYIQRIIENLQFYRARLNGGQAPLKILQDLKG